MRTYIYKMIRMSFSMRFIQADKVQGFISYYMIYLISRYYAIGMKLFTMSCLSEKYIYLHKVYDTM